MLGTKVVATSGMLLTLLSLLLGPEFWGYQNGVIMLQIGVLALGLGLFLKINENQVETGPLHLLDDIEVRHQQSPPVGPS